MTTINETAKRETPAQQFRELLWDVMDSIDIHNRARPSRELQLAQSQWTMLSERFGATFRPGAEFRRIATAANGR